MNLQEAQSVATVLSAKLKADGHLTNEEQAAYKNATDFIDAVSSTARDYASTQRDNMSVDDKIDAGMGKKVNTFWTPGRRLAAEVIGGIAIATIGVFGGMRLERSRSNSRNSNLLDNLGMSNTGPGVGQHHVDSPQSHPAVSPDDQRLVQNRNQGGQGNQGGRQRANANA